MSCLTCVSATVCQMCVVNYYYYSVNSSCLVSCPSAITIPSVGTPLTCLLCASQCLTCSNVTTNCTSCINGLVLSNNNTYGICTNNCGNINMIIINNICTVCDNNCYTCYSIVTNCTSCYSNSTYKYLYNNTCISTCP